MAFTSVMNWVASFRQGPPHSAGCSPLELLPTELLSKIIRYVAEQQITRSYKRLEYLSGDKCWNQEQLNLIACLAVSQRLHGVTLPIMYRDPRLIRFQKFPTLLGSRPDLGQLVLSLDISRFGAIIPPEVIGTCLSRTPRLRKCRLLLEDLGEEELLETIFSRMQHLEVLEVETRYPSARGEWRIPDVIHNFFMNSPTSVGETITSLTCNPRDIQCSKMFEAMLPNLSNLRALNVAQTDIACKALRGIPTTVRLTHLDVTYCRNLSGAEFADFLVNHPAVKESLAVLHASNVSLGGQLLEEDEVTTILSHAPPTLRTLNLAYSDMNRTHLPYLQKLSGQLEGLGVGRNLYLRDIEDAVMAPRYTFDPEDHNIDSWKSLEDEPKCESILGPMKDAVAVCKLRRRLHSVSQKPHRSSTCTPSKIRYVDISSIPPQEQGKLKESVLWAKQSMPLEAIEISSARLDDFNMLPRLCGAVGWRNRWVDGRVWVERM